MDSRGKLKAGDRTGGLALTGFGSRKASFSIKRQELFIISLTDQITTLDIEFTGKSKFFPTEECPAFFRVSAGVLISQPISLAMRTILATNWALLSAICALFVIDVVLKTDPNMAAQQDGLNVCRHFITGDTHGVEHGIRRKLIHKLHQELRGITHVGSIAPAHPQNKIDPVRFGQKALIDQVVNFVH